MKTHHLSELQIQQYSLDPENCSPDIQAHIALCGACRVKALNYRLVLSALKTEPEPAFDFDLSTLVLAKLNPAPKKHRRTYAALIVLAGLVLIIPAWLFGAYWKPLVSGISQPARYLIISASILVMVFQAADMYKKWQRLCQELNVR